MEADKTIIELFGKMPYKPLVEEIKDYAIFHLDANGRILSWNQGAKTIFGYGKDEIIGQDFKILFTSEDLDQEVPEKELEKAEQTGRAEDTRWHVRKDNSLFFADGATTALRDENEKLIGYAKIARDRTAGKQMEEALLESEERYRIVAETASDAIISIDEQSTILFINRAGERIFGYEIEQMIGHPLTMLMPEYMRHVHSAGIQHYLETGKRHLSWEHVEVPGLHREGYEFPLELSFGEFRKKNGNVFIGIARDISDRKRVEAEREQLLQREQAARKQATNILERITDGFVSVDREWQLTFINRAGARMVGRRPEELLGRNIWESYPDIVGTKYETEYNRALREQIPVEFEEFLPSVDKWLEVNAYPSSSGLSIFFRDVTERKRIEAEQVNLLVREQEARRAAEEANRIKDEFLATLSHELRTPLNAILGWSNLLRSGKLDKEASTRALETVERNARSQSQLIDDLLDISRIITGKLRLEVGSIELSKVIEAAIDAIRPAAEAKNIRLQLILDTETGAVSGDSNRLQQVFWNLLTNAVKFTPKGGRIQVRLERINSHVEIIVSDTGQGIAPEFLPHMFDRFRQADQTASRIQGGLGLGLSIVRQLVEMHGGTVHAESEGEGKGTTFVVKLPRQITVPRKESSAEERVHPTMSDGFISIDCAPQLDGLHVLVVDDEADSRELLRVVLEHCGSEVTTAGSAAEALAALEENQPDILVSDIGMPEEDGYTLIQKIRTLPGEKGGRIPAVALTAYARVEDRVRALTAGFQVHVPKPVEPVELAAVVASLAKSLGKI